MISHTAALENRQRIKADPALKTKKKQKKKGGFTSLLGIFILILGLGIMAFPSISEAYNRRHQNNAIVNYQQAVAEADTDRILQKAIEYNRMIYDLPNPFSTFRRIDGYEDQLNADGSGMMGWITIDKIGVKLAIYHGTETEVLNHAVGHLPGSSLPVGGQNSHSVLMAHRGLPTATLFSNLDELELGDYFYTTILDEEYWYEVDEIYVVSPKELDMLYIEEGQDQITLITCTPYGINTDRLLVRGSRCEKPQDEQERGLGLNDWIVLGIAGFVILVILILALCLIGIYRKEGREKKSDGSLDEAGK